MNPTKNHRWLHAHEESSMIFAMQLFISLSKELSRKINEFSC